MDDKIEKDIDYDHPTFCVKKCGQVSCGKDSYDGLCIDCYEKEKKQNYNSTSIIEQDIIIEKNYHHHHQFLDDSSYSAVNICKPDRSAIPSYTSVINSNKTNIIQTDLNDFELTNSSGFNSDKKQQTIDHQDTIYFENQMEHGGHRKFDFNKPLLDSSNTTVLNSSKETGNIAKDNKIDGLLKSFLGKEFASSANNCHSTTSIETSVKQNSSLNNDHDSVDTFSSCCFSAKKDVLITSSDYLPNFNNNLNLPVNKNNNILSLNNSNLTGNKFNENFRKINESNSRTLSTNNSVNNLDEKLNQPNPGGSYKTAKPFSLRGRYISGNYNTSNATSTNNNNNGFNSNGDSGDQSIVDSFYERVKTSSESRFSNNMLDKFNLKKNDSSINTFISSTNATKNNFTGFDLKNVKTDNNKNFSSNNLNRNFLPYSNLENNNKFLSRNNILNSPVKQVNNYYQQNNFNKTFTAFSNNSLSCSPNRLNQSADYKNKLSSFYSQNDRTRINKYNSEGNFLLKNQSNYSASKPESYLSANPLQMSDNRDFSDNIDCPRDESIIFKDNNLKSLNIPSDLNVNECSIQDIPCCEHKKVLSNNRYINNNNNESIHISSNLNQISNSDLDSNNDYYEFNKSNNYSLKEKNTASNDNIFFSNSEKNQEYHYNPVLKKKENIEKQSCSDLSVVDNIFDKNLIVQQQDNSTRKVKKNIGFSKATTRSNINNNNFVPTLKKEVYNFELNSSPIELNATRSDKIVTATGTTPIDEDKPKCPVCLTLLALTDFSCKCGKIFCINHRHPELHKCEFDFFSDSKINSGKNIKMTFDNTNDQK